jgi:hypothetical protein
VSRTIVTGLASLTVIALAACRPPARPERQAPRAETNIVRVEATEYSFSMPDRITGGVTMFEMANIGDLPHQILSSWVEEGTDRLEALRALEQGRRLEGLARQPGVTPLSPQMTMSMTGRVDPGTYVFFCKLPSPEGKAAVALGMFKFFQVSGNSRAAPPDPAAAIVSTAEGFEVPEIEAGRQVLELRNEGEHTAQFLLFSPQPGKRERDIDRWFESGYEGDAPAIFPGGVTFIEPGFWVIVTVEFEAGRTYQLRDFDNGFLAEITPS